MDDLELFQRGDVYLDDPFEEMKFRYEKATNKVYARAYGQADEVEIKHSSARYKQAVSSGKAITRDAYFSDEGGG